MKANRKYLVAVALLAVLAVVFGFAGASAPMSKPVSTEKSSSSSDSVTHFVNPPTYDSDWVNITDKCGQHVTLVHNLSTMDVTVDITGRTAILTEENWHQFWSMGDVNRDGYIDDTDGDLIVAAFGSYPGHPNWNPDADLNQDLVVNVLDLTIFSFNYGLDIWTYFGAGVHQRHLGGTGYMPGWSRTYGGADGDGAQSMVQTSDGGYALAGYTNSYGAGNNDFWLVKTDFAGNMQWSKTYGGTNDDVANSLIQTMEGGYALAGYTASYGAGYDDFWLVKTDSAGNHVWNQTYGGTGYDWASSVVQTVDGGYALAGYTDSFGAGWYDFWLVKTDASGNNQWNKTYGRTNSDLAYSVVQTVDGGYALAGYTESLGAPYDDFWLVKTDSDGTMLWNRTYGGISADRAWSMVQTDDGGYTLAGHTLSFGAGSIDFWLVKTDSDGNIVWSQTYGGVEWDIAYSVVQTSDGGYASAGFTQSFGAGSTDFWLVKTDASGTVQWSKTYGGTNGDVAYSVVQTVDGGYALAGYTDSFGAGGYDFWLVKTDVESGLAWTGLTSNSITLYRGKTDLYWNYVRVRIWTIQEPTWQFGDMNQDGVVDAKDLAIIGRNYGKTFSALSLGGVIAIAGIYTYKKCKRPK